MKVARADGVCRACQQPVILVAEDTGFSLFHKDPPCEAFDGDPESEYAKKQVTWPQDNQQSN